MIQKEKHTYSSPQFTTTKYVTDVITASTIIDGEDNVIEFEND